MLSESSFIDLYHNTVRAFPKTTKRQYATQPLEVVEVRFTPYLGMKTLYVKGMIRNEDRHYDSIMLFKAVDYREDAPLRIRGIEGKIYHLEPLTIENDILVRCNCADHFWRFRHYNHLDRSLYGRDRKKYEAIHSPGSANPLKLPGLCKHLIKLAEMLNQSDILV
jgi:hypothetical protein